jgi:two-component system, NarL family, nitrate/nitrite response regulator NarL
MGDVQDLAAAYCLSGREREVVRLASLGLTDKQIATQLGLADGTIGVHLCKVFQKLGVRNRTAMVAALARTKRGVASDPD